MDRFIFCMFINKCFQDIWWFLKTSFPVNCIFKKIHEDNVKKLEMKHLIVKQSLNVQIWFWLQKGDLCGEKWTSWSVIDILWRY